MDFGNSTVPSVPLAENPEGGDVEPNLIPDLSATPSRLGIYGDHGEREARHIAEVSEAENLRRQAGEKPDVVAVLLSTIVQHLRKHFPVDQIVDTDAVTLDGNGNGVIVFKRFLAEQEWLVTGYGLKSVGAHTFTVEIFADTDTSNPVSLVDFSNGSDEYTADRNSPVIVPSSRFLIVKISGGTSGDTIYAHIQGYRR